MMTEKQIRAFVGSLERDVEYFNKEGLTGISEQERLDIIRIQKAKIITLRWVLGEKV